MKRTAAGEAAAEAIPHHPGLRDLPRSDREQSRLFRFSAEIARYLAGDDPSTLGPLARVLTRIARRELDDARRLSRGQALLATEAAVAAVHTLWPLVRGPLETEDDVLADPEPAADPEPKQGVTGGLGGAGGGGDQGGDPSAGQTEGGEGSEDGQTEDEHEEGEGSGDGASEPNDDGAETEPDLEVDARLARSLARELAKHDVTAMLHAAAQRAVDVALAAGELERWLERIIPGMGWSMGIRDLDHELIGRLDQVAALLQKLPTLEEIADRIGRLEGERGKGRGLRGGSEEVVGVHFGGEVSLALPSELALLGDPETEDLFYARWLERQLVSLRMDGAGLYGEGAGDRRGPVIACVDTSGSMEGEPELLAKAFVLALARRMRNRALHLLLFGGPSQTAELRLGRGRAGLRAFLAFLGRTFRAGTDFDTPLRRAVALLDERDLVAADVLVITDGLGRAGADVIREVNSVRARRGVRVWSVLVGAGQAATVAPFSDVVWSLLDPEPHDLAEIGRSSS